MEAIPMCLGAIKIR